MQWNWQEHKCQCIPGKPAKWDPCFNRLRLKCTFPGFAVLQPASLLDEKQALVLGIQAAVSQHDLDVKRLQASGALLRADLDAAAGRVVSLEQAKVVNCWRLGAVEHLRQDMWWRSTHALAQGCQRACLWWHMQ